MWAWQQGKISLYHYRERYRYRNNTQIFGPTHIENAFRFLCIQVSLHSYVIVNPITSAAISIPLHDPLLYSNSFSQFIFVSELVYEKYK